MEESEIRRAQFLDGLWPDLWAAMAYTKETGVDEKKADYGQLLRIAQQFKKWGQSQWCSPQSYRLGLSKKVLPHGVSARVTDVWEEDNTEVQTCTNEQEDPIGAHADLDESFPGVSIHMATVVQHYEKVEKRCFICNEPSHFARDCPQWEEFCSQNLNHSKGLGMKGAWDSLPKKTD